MRKKFLCAIMAAIMAAEVLAGCGKTQDFEDTGKEAVEESEIESEVDAESETESEVHTEAVEESTEEKDEYLTIDTYTICNRELHDFFQLYLGCWVDCRLNKKSFFPSDIDDMLQCTGVVGSFIVAEGMRVVADYDNDNFAGLGNYTKIRNVTESSSRNASTVNYNCSVSTLDANFTSFRYKAGTDAELRLFVKVVYNCSGTTDKSGEEMYAVSLVNNADMPEEWLINKILLAGELNNADKEKAYYSECNYLANNLVGNLSIDDRIFIGDKLVDEDRETVDTGQMSGWRKAYIDYFNNSSLNPSMYQYIIEDINSDNIPEIFLFLIGASSADESEFYYVNKDNEVKDIALSNIYSFYADNGVLYLTGGRTGYYQDIIYQCNASGDYECVFEGEFEDYVSDGEVSFRYYIGENEISEEEYKKLLAVYGDIENMKHFSAEDSNQGDVISAIQNYASEQNAEDSKNADASQISDWKNAYINYFNNLDEQVDSYRLIDINGDNIPEIYYEHRVVYLNNNNEAKVIDSLNQFCSYNSKSICAYDHIGGGDIYVIYGYNNSQGEYELVFEGREYPEINDERDQIGNIFYINGVEVSPEEYESKFNEVSGNEEYNFLDEESELSYGDIVSAIQNYQ